MTHHDFDRSGDSTYFFLAESYLETAETRAIPRLADNFVPRALFFQRPPRPRAPWAPCPPIVGSSDVLRPRAGGIQPSIDGPFCTNRTSALSGLPVRYCCPALPQNFPALSVALRLTVSKA